ncbi:hypothetical protein TcWFU_010080 [Taenia crassiceps]|uniref:Uncharacterized protein n=1 Tax=Taenia crassiceps TaxID=6207 RepID=A0ABR4Q8T4_9CEST
MTHHGVVGSLAAAGGDEWPGPALADPPGSRFPACLIFLTVPSSDVLAVVSFTVTPVSRNKARKQIRRTLPWYSPGCVDVIGALDLRVALFELRLTHSSIVSFFSIRPNDQFMKLWTIPSVESHRLVLDG